MGDLIRFQREKAIQADIEFHGSGERYTLQAHTATGAEFVLTNLETQRFSPEERKPMMVEDSREAEAIAAGALRSGCRVRVNGKEL